MKSWGEFKSMAPELAAYGERRFHRARVAFLATVAADGTPRVNPVQPVICHDRLLLFLEPTSPKSADLKRNGVFAMHSLVDNPVGVGGEFSIKGKATLLTDEDIRNNAIEASCYTPSEEYVLFELKIDAALARDYEDGKIVMNRWEPASV